MLTSLEVYNPSGESLNLPIASISSGYGVADIVGLDPVKATLVSSSFALQDGAQFQASRRDNRNIVITLSFEPDFVSTNIEGLRAQLYKYFMTEQAITLNFIQSTGPTVTITGVVEAFDAPRFAKDIKSTISILCFKPDFIDPTERTFTGATTSSTSDTALTYNGTVETGFIFTLTVGRALTGFTIWASRPGSPAESLLVDGVSLVAGDVVTISTVTGNKYAKMLRGAAETNILNQVSPFSSWLNLFAGANSVRVQTAAGTSMAYTIKYTEKYGGL